MSQGEFSKINTQYAATLQKVHSIGNFNRTRTHKSCRSSTNFG